MQVGDSDHAVPAESALAKESRESVLPLRVGLLEKRPEDADVDMSFSSRTKSHAMVSEVL